MNNGKKKVREEREKQIQHEQKQQEQIAAVEPRARALAPIVVFLFLYVGSGIYYQYVKGQDQGFYVMSVVVAFSLAIVVALLQNRKLDFEAKLKVMASGVGDENIIAMLFIFIFAGAFSGIATAAGGSVSTAYWLLDIVPSGQITVGFFLIACVISMAMGTSCGTISVLVPIAVATAKASGLNLGILLGAIIGGAMFGDNISFISDTTIAATRTQGCEMKDKFRENFSIALPAAVITLIILAIKGAGSGTIENLSYNFLQAIPYFIVLVMALLGLNVLLVLGTGTVLFGVVGFITVKGFSVSLILKCIGDGVSGMYETMIVAVLVAALGALMKEYGGFAYLLQVICKVFKGKRGGQFGIAILSSVMDIATANNTVAIVMAAPIAKEISKEYGISPQKTASLMDIFSCIWQGIIPYGAQMLIALGLVTKYKMSAFQIIPHIYYLPLLFICAMIAIFLPDVPGKRKKGKEYA